MQALLEIGLSNALAATVLAATVWALTRFFRRAPLARWLWLLVLLKLLTPPLVEIPLGEMLGLSAPVVAASSANYQDPRTFDADPSSPISVETRLALSGGHTGMDLARVLPVLLASVWLAGSVVWFVVAVVRIYQFHRLVESADMAPEKLSAEVRRLARKFALRQPPEVRVAAVRTGPLVWAMWARPTVLLPAKLWERFTASQQATLLAHELAHLRRGDHWVRWLELLALGLYWWHPIVWYARRKLRQAEEECCDAWVLWAFPDLARTYAEALIGAIDFLSEARPVRPVAATGLGQVPLMKRRFEMILHNGLCRHASWTTRLVMLAATALVLPLAPVAMSGADPCEKEPVAEVPQATARAANVPLATIPLVPPQPSVAQTNTPATTGEELAPVQTYLVECRVVDKDKDGRSKVVAAPTLMMPEGARGFFQTGGEVPLQVGAGTVTYVSYGLTVQMTVRPDGQDRVVLQISVQRSEVRESGDANAGNPIIASSKCETACLVQLGQKLTLMFGETPMILLGEYDGRPQDHFKKFVGPRQDRSREEISEQYVEFVVKKGPVRELPVSIAKKRAAGSRQIMSGRATLPTASQRRPLPPVSVPPRR